jgi:hypothetical protein
VELGTPAARDGEDTAGAVPKARLAFMPATHLSDEDIYAGRVAARPGEASDKTKLDRIITDAEDYRDRCARSFGCDRSGRAAGRVDNGHATADQVSHQRRQAIELAVQPVVLDRHVLTVDVAGVAPERRSFGAHAGSGRRVGEH